MEDAGSQTRHYLEVFALNKHDEAVKRQHEERQTCNTLHAYMFISQKETASHLCLKLDVKKRIQVINLFI